MKDYRHFFKELLCIELDDLTEDIHQVIGVCADKRRKEEITHYVQMENTAFLQDEILGLRGYREDVMRYDIESPRDVDEMARALKALLADRVRLHDLPPALIPLVERRIDKVLNYVRQGKDSPVKE